MTKHMKKMLKQAGFKLMGGSWVTKLYEYGEETEYEAYITENPDDGIPYVMVGELTEGGIVDESEAIHFSSFVLMHLT